jgi:hypothetical protein
MMTPTIHMNGTSQERLLQQVLDTTDALRQALAKLREATPNGRDYYPQGPEAIYAALDEYRDRDKRLRAVLAELEELAMAISDGGKK